MLFTFYYILHTVKFHNQNQLSVSLQTWAIEWAIQHTSSNVGHKDDHFDNIFQMSPT